MQKEISLYLNPLVVPIQNQDIGYRLELCNLRADPFFSFPNKTGAEFFKLLSNDLYPSLRNFGLKLSSMLGSSYPCESGFSTMNLIKSKHRSSVTDDWYTQN